MQPLTERLRHPGANAIHRPCGETKGDWLRREGGGQFVNLFLAWMEIFVSDFCKLVMSNQVYREASLWSLLMKCWFSFCPNSTQISILVNIKCLSNHPPIWKMAHMQWESKIVRSNVDRCVSALTVSTWMSLLFFWWIPENFLEAKSRFEDWETKLSTRVIWSVRFYRHGVD